MENHLTQITNYLLTQSWQIAVLAVVIAAMSLALKNRSAHIRYLLWLIVLAKCLAPPLVTIPLAILPQESLVEPVPILPAELPAATIERVNTPITEPPIPISAPVVKEKAVRLTVHQWLGFGWVVGVAVFAVFGVIKAWRTNLWLCRQRKPLPAKLQSGIEDLFSGFDLKTLAKIWLLEGISQPFVWGLLRGSIYLPADFVKVDNAEHRKGVLGHELSHILRFDAAVNLLQVMAQAIFWFHPLVWWVNKRIRAEREKCCDEMTIASLGAKVKDYSTAIVNILIREQESTRPVPSLAVAGPVKNIEERIKTMLRPGKKFYKRPSLIAATIVLLLALLTVPTALVLTARAETKPTAEQKPEPAKSLHQAAADGDIEQVKLLISKGADVNERGGWGNTPLHYASREGHAEVARLLISKGAYVNAPDGRNAMTPLHCAAASGDKQTVELLLSKGAYLHAKQKYGRTALFEAMRSAAPGRKEIVELLVAKGAKVPPLHLAAYMGEMDKVKKGLQDGADINSQADDGGTALHAAGGSGRKDIVELLVSRGANVDPKDGSGLTPLYYAATHNAKEIVNLLVAKGADVNAKHEYGFTLLHYAIFQDESKDAVNLLISKGPNVNVGDDDGFTPLNWAIWWSDKDMVELLIGKGADVNQEDNYGCTALHYASGKKDLVELLIAKGAAPISAIYSAARAGDLEKVKSLVEEGEDVNRRAKGSGGYTPLFAAIFGGHNDVAKFLIAKGADVNAKDMAGQTPLHCACEHGNKDGAELLIAKGADVNARDYGGATPLHRIFYSGRNRMDVAELLLAKGANVNVKLTDDWLTRLTPLHFAVESGHTKIVGLFIAKGADINAPKTDGQTPLHIACKFGHKDVAELLVDKGADVNTKDNKGRTALSLAKEQGHEEIVELLRKHGAKE